jgi:hypothetical protein
MRCPQDVTKGESLEQHAFAGKKYTTDGGQKPRFTRIGKTAAMAR